MASNPKPLARNPNLGITTLLSKFPEPSKCAKLIQLTNSSEHPSRRCRAEGFRFRDLGSGLSVYGFQGWGLSLRAEGKSHNKDYDVSGVSEHPGYPSGGPHHKE